MKHLLLLVLLLLAIPAFAATAIVTNNTGNATAEDTLSVTFFVTDTIGNFAQADSFYVLIFSPTGDSIYAASYISSAPEIHALTLGTTGRKGYRWTESIADIDGSSPRSGTFAGVLIAVDTLDGPSAARLDQGFTFSFILEPTLADRVKIGDTSSCAGQGTGAFSITLTAVDSTTDFVIPGADIAVRNLDQSALLATAQTDPLGHATVHLNAADYIAIASAPGFIFTGCDTINISGPNPGAFSLYGYHFDPGTPSSPSLCRVYSYVYNVDGQPEPGATVTASIPSGAARSGALVISPFGTTTTTDSQGYFYLDLIPSDNLNPSGTKYEFTITRRDGTILRHRVKVPTTSSWLLEW